MKVLVIGAGNMGLAYAKVLVKSEYLSKSNLMISDTDPAKTKELKKNSRFDVYSNLKDCLPKADIVFIAVKPYHTEELFAELKPMTKKDQVIVSLMAGVKIKSIQDGLGIVKVVRAMPNLPAQIGKGLTSFTTSAEVSRLETSTVQQLLNTTGKSVHLDTENDIDASTGISGSGPAYVFYFMQSMMEAAKKMGFSDHDSKVLVSQTFEGAVELFNQSDLTPTSWMNKVASKGGTTRAALDSMDDMKPTLRIITLLTLAVMIFQACQEAPNSSEETQNKVEKKSIKPKKKSLNPNGDSELAMLMRKMFSEAKRMKEQVQNGEEVTMKVDHEKILTAHATEPAKAASAEYKSWGAAYLAGVETLKNATPETAEAAYTSLVNSCMNCHQALCPGPVVKIKKLKIPA